MYDIKPLEEQWERYNRKRKRPLYMMLFLVILLTGVTALFLENKNVILSKIEDMRKSSVPSEHDSDVFFEHPLDRLALKEPSSPVQDVKPVVDNDNPMNPEDVFVDADENVRKPLDAAVQTVKKEKVKRKLHFEMIDANSAEAYTEVKNRFEMAPDPDDSLFLARNYYHDGAYSKAAYWALQTNKLNGDIEESWLIFARAKAKIGQKNEAIRVLTQYVSKSHSIEARKLLKKLKNK